LNAGGGNWFDVAAFHGYVDGHGESIISQVTDFKNALTGGNAADKPIWDTEWGWWPDVLDDAAQQAAFVSTRLYCSGPSASIGRSTMATTTSVTAFTMFDR